jgi:hypothetical protein
MHENTRQKLEPVIQEFVEEKLKERYKDHCTDKMLVSIIMNLIRLSSTSDICVGEAMLKDNGNCHAYYIGCMIFESILEHGAGAGGNGHHVAQDFQVFIEKYRR